MQATGLFRNTVAGTQRAFTQVFLLHPQEPKGYFILNEIFVYADHEEIDEADRSVLDVAPKQEEKGAAQEAVEKVKEKEEEEEEPAAIVEEVTETVQEQQPVEPSPSSTPVEETESPADEVAPVEEEKKEKKTKDRKERKKKKDQKKESSEVPAEATVPQEAEQTPEVPSKDLATPNKKESSAAFSWDSVRHDNATPVSTPAVVPTQRTTAPARQATENKSASATSEKTGADTRFVEVSNFDLSANKDTLKAAFASFGVPRYISFQGQSRAILEFEDAQIGALVIASKKVSVFASGEVR